MRWVHPPDIIQRLFPRILWRYPTDEPILFLTFDDGPTPNTSKILKLLKTYNAKASFFCSGQNIVQHKEIFQSVKNAGHLTGNHTFSHLHPLKAKNKILYDEVERTNKYTQTIYFRPPYGKLKLRQFLSLKKKYQIVLWDVLSYDWDTTLAPSECAQIAKKHIRKGSIIVFHDSPQAYPRMIYSLKSILKEYSDKGYSFITLENVYS